MKFFCEMSGQLRSGGGGGIQKSGYDEWQFFAGSVVVVGFSVVVVVGWVVVVVATVVVVVTGVVVVVSATVVVVAAVVVVVLDEVVVVEDDVDDVPAREVVVESTAALPPVKRLPRSTTTTSPLGM